MKKPAEHEIGAVVVSWLEAAGWEVFQEVQAHTAGRRADIVARKNGTLWVVECKVSAGLGVIEQAEAWEGATDYISVAVFGSRQSSLFMRACRWLNVGVIRVYEDWYGKRPLLLEESVPATTLTRRNQWLADALRDGHKTHAKAGESNGSNVFTPFRATCDEILRVATEAPGLSIKEVVGRIQHHYSNDASARGALLKWIHDGKVRGVTTEHRGRRVVIVPVETP